MSIEVPGRPVLDEIVRWEEGGIGQQLCGLPDHEADSGNEDEPFEDTPFDDEPCDVGIDTEQNPEDPATLRVTLQATFADDSGACPDGGGADLPDGDGDGDGDLPDCGAGEDPTDSTDPTDPDGSDPVGPGDQPVDGDGSGGANPLATTSFTLTP